MVDDAPSARSGMAKLVCFYLHGQEYAADINDIKETMLVRPITHVFLTPSWLSGIINLRGDIVAVIDLAQLLGLPPTALTDTSRIVITTHRGKVGGILVDRMAELRNLATDELQPAPPVLSAEGAALLRGVVTLDGGEAVRVLNLANLFESERLRAFQRAT